MNAMKNLKHFYVYRNGFKGGLPRLEGLTGLKSFVGRDCFFAGVVGGEWIVGNGTARGGGTGGTTGNSIGNSAGNIGDPDVNVVGVPGGGSTRASAGSTLKDSSMEEVKSMRSGMVSGSVSGIGTRGGPASTFLPQSSRPISSLRNQLAGQGTPSEDFRSGSAAVMGNRGENLTSDSVNPPRFQNQLEEKKDGFCLFPVRKSLSKPSLDIFKASVLEFVSKPNTATPNPATNKSDDSGAEKHATARGRDTLNPRFNNGTGFNIKSTSTGGPSIRDLDMSSMLDSSRHKTDGSSASASFGSSASMAMIASHQTNSVVPLLRDFFGQMSRYLNEARNLQAEKAAVVEVPVVQNTYPEELIKAMEERVGKVFETSIRQRDEDALKEQSKPLKGLEALIRNIKQSLHQSLEETTKTIQTDLQTTTLASITDLQSRFETLSKDLSNLHQTCTKSFKKALDAQNLVKVCREMLDQQGSMRDAISSMGDGFVTLKTVVAEALEGQERLQKAVVALAGLQAKNQLADLEAAKVRESEKDKDKMDVVGRESLADIQARLERIEARLNEPTPVPQQPLAIRPPPPSSSKPAQHQLAILPPASSSKPAHQSLAILPPASSTHNLESSTSTKPSAFAKTNAKTLESQNNAAARKAASPDAQKVPDMFAAPRGSESVKSEGDAMVVDAGTSNAVSISRSARVTREIIVLDTPEDDDDKTEMGDDDEFFSCLWNEAGQGDKKAGDPSITAHQQQHQPPLEVSKIDSTKVMKTKSEPSAGPTLVEVDDDDCIMLPAPKTRRMEHGDATKANLVQTEVRTTRSGIGGGGAGGNGLPLDAPVINKWLESAAVHGSGIGPVGNGVDQAGGSGVGGSSKVPNVADSNANPAAAIATPVTDAAATVKTDASAVEGMGAGGVVVGQKRKRGRPPRKAAAKK
ncbi:hypothetical protein HDU76_004552 [Blyttiomyces sp. JEL0837]|nr:hypothetical protein HDU76_004552 [Blyttiomyces sp. JEL0837]